MKVQFVLRRHFTGDPVLVEGRGVVVEFDLPEGVVKSDDGGLVLEWKEEHVSDPLTVR